MISSGEDQMPNDLSFEFERGKATFTYLPYGEQNPEKGVMLYNISDDRMTIQNANEVLNGIWTVTKENKEMLILTRNVEDQVYTISLHKRR